MLYNRLVPVENEVSMCFILYRIRPWAGGGGGGIPYKSHTGRAALPGRVFGPLARKQCNRFKTFYILLQTGSKIPHKLEQRPTL